MVNKRLVFTVTGMIIFVAVILGYVHFSKISRNEKKVNQQTMSQTQTIQQADTETEKEEVNASGDELENVTAGSEEYRGFLLDNVLHSPNKGDIHYNVYIPDSYDGTKKYALYVTLPGYQGLYFQGGGENIRTEDFGFEAQKYINDMIIVAPQLNDWEQTSADQTIELTQYFLTHYKINSSKVYINGYSGGGETLSLVLAKQPELYTAALMCSSIGYKVGPQFFRGLKKDGLPQVGFAVLMCVGCLVITWILALIMGYNAGEAAGLLAGAQTISAVIGVADDTINGLNISTEQKNNMINIIPVAYAVTYIYGTAGSAWVLSSLGPKMLGGLEKVKAACKELEAKMGTSEADEPGFEHARRPVVFRAYTIENDWFGNGKTVEQLESYFISQGKRLFVERMRHNHTIINEILPGQLLQKGDEVVLSGRREFAIGEEDWIGEEVIDPQLLDFPVEVLPVMIHKKPYANRKLEFIRKQPFMHGVSVRRIKRAGIDIPVFAQTVVDSGDTLELVGLKKEVETAAKQLGYIDRPTNATDMVFVGIGILIGGVIGALAIHIGGVPISLSTSGGALIAGLVFGWLRSKHPTFGQIPESSLWVLNNVGLNMFIAVVGISAPYLSL